MEKCTNQKHDYQLTEIWIPGRTLRFFNSPKKVLGKVSTLDTRIFELPGSQIQSLRALKSPRSLLKEKHTLLGEKLK